MAENNLAPASPDELESRRDSGPGSARNQRRRQDRLLLTAFALSGLTARVGSLAKASDAVAKADEVLALLDKE